MKTAYSIALATMIVGFSAASVANAAPVTPAAPIQLAHWHGGWGWHHHHHGWGPGWGPGIVLPVPVPVPAPVVYRYHSPGNCYVYMGGMRRYGYIGGRGYCRVWVGGRLYKFGNYNRY